MSETKVTPVFPTYIAVRQWEDTDHLNACLRAEVEKMRAYDPDGLYRSNASGTWHSRDIALTETGPAGVKLGSMFRTLFADLAHSHGGAEGNEYAFKMAAWAMRYQDRGYAAVHNHPNCHFSGVYYVDTGSDKEADERIGATGVNAPSGCLEFLDTRSVNLQVQGLALQPSARFHPKAGLMIAFPSWLPHYVHPCVGDGVRVSIACNATVQDIRNNKDQ